MIKSVRELVKRFSKYSTQHPFRALILLIILVIVVIPFILQLVMAVLSFGIFKIGTNDGWLGFWGGYLGTILGIPISVIIAVDTIKEGQRQVIKSKQFRYREKISECATKYQIEIQSTTRYPLSEQPSVKLIKLYYSRLSGICTTSKDSFFTEYYINCAKLPKEQRNKHSDTIIQLSRYLEKLNNEYLSFSENFEIETKLLEAYENSDGSQEDSNSQRNYQDTINRYYTKMQEIRPLLIKITKSLSKISDLSIEEIKF